MPVWTVKEDRKNWARGDKLPLRHVKEDCNVLKAAKDGGRTVERHNNTEKLRSETERCGACWDGDGLPDSGDAN